MELGYHREGFGLSWTPDVVLALTPREAGAYRVILNERLKADRDARK